MKLRSLLTVAALATSLDASAQVWVSDSISMGAGYAKDVYYHMGTGFAKEDSNSRWDLAFSAIPATAMSNPHYGVGAWINRERGGVKLYSIHKVASTNFTTLSSADTGAALTGELANSDTSYAWGAFNLNGSGAHPNYGWGTYNTTTHNIEGDSIYIARKGSVAYKIWIQKYNSVPPTTWKFLVQKLDKSTPVDTVTINVTTDYANRVMAYYSFANGKIDREPASSAWDINFTRYTSNIDLGGGVGPNPVTGVFINPYVKVGKAWHTNADTTHYQNYALSHKLNVIGRDWKTNNLNSSFTAYILDTVNYFVLSNDGHYYQLEFTGATTSTLGKTYFRKRALVTTAIHNVNNSISNYYAAPNPANNEVTLMMDTKESSENATIALVDMSGRTISRYTVNVNKGINAFSVNTAIVPTGLYLLSVTGTNIRLTQKINVAH